MSIAIAVLCTQVQRKVIELKMSKVKNIAKQQQKYKLSALFSQFEIIIILIFNQKF